MFENEGVSGGSVVSHCELQVVLWDLTFILLYFLYICVSHPCTSVKCTNKYQKIVINLIHSNF